MGVYMTNSKIKAFLIILVFVISITLILKIFNHGFSFQEGEFFVIIFYSFIMSFGLLLTGIQNILIKYFDNKYYKEQEEIDFQTNLRRELQRKRALSEIDNENLHYQNQLKIEYIAQVAQIQLQSNQYLANMYQQAIINNSTQNELTAQRQLLELEAELQKQGLI